MADRHPAVRAAEDATPSAPLRDQIVAKVHAVDCGCLAPDVHTPDSLDFYREVAESVMELRELADEIEGDNR